MVAGFFPGYGPGTIRNQIGAGAALEALKAISRILLQMGAKG